MRPIPGYEGLYSVTSDGRVFSHRLRRFISLKNRVNGYVTTGLSIDSKSRGFSVHRLVASAFLGLDLLNPKIHVDHIDCDKSNNDVSNLRVCTVFENQAAKVGRLGIDNSVSRLCSKCRKVLSRDQFYKNTKYSDGLTSRCISCCKER